MRVGQQGLHRLHIGAIGATANQFFVVDHIERRIAHDALGESSQQGRAIDEPAA